MPTIAPLPASSSRLLSSHVGITTPVALVKELIDNSVDANATSIEVLISANTVSRIEVRDNGAGIHPDDYDALGRRGHTSKLRSFEELKTQCAKTLGFRGEALANANSQGTLCITTKTEAEPVAATLSILAGTGGVAQQRVVSAPVGTSVNVTNLFGRLPVREQVAIKDSKKSLDQIQDLLRSYAMARPLLRFSLKVLPSSRPTWSYSPKTTATIKEAVLQIFGAESAAHFIERIFEVNDQAAESQPSDDNSFSPGFNHTFEALVLKPSADISKTPKHQYFSVDGRPVTPKRGTMKKLLVIYVESLKAALEQSVSSKPSSDFFVRLNIVCPPGTYDANVEPAKDDVLFANEEIVVKGFQSLCQKVYKPSNTQAILASPVPASIENAVGENRASNSVDHYDGHPTGSVAGRIIPASIVPRLGDSMEANSVHLMPTRSNPDRQDHPTNVQATDPGVLKEAPIQFTPINRPTLPAQDGIERTNREDRLTHTTQAPRVVDMSKDMSQRVRVDRRDTLRKRSRTSNQILPIHEENVVNVQIEASQVINPWTIARMNAPVQPPHHDIISAREFQESCPNPIFEPPMTPEPPILQHPSAPPGDLAIAPSQRFLHVPSNVGKPMNNVPGGPYRSPLSSPISVFPQNQPAGVQRCPRATYQGRGPNLPWSPPSSVEKIRNLRKQAPGYGTPKHSNSLKQTTISFSDTDAVPTPEDHRSRNDTHSFGGIAPMTYNKPTLPDYRHLRDLFTSVQRDFDFQLSHQNILPDHSANSRADSPRVRQQRRQENPSMKSSNVMEIEIGARLAEDREPVKTTLPTGDPRAYLLRRQKSLAAEEGQGRPKKHRRMKSSLLTLENIPHEAQTHTLSLTMSLSLEVLLDWTEKIARYDLYVADGSQQEGLELSLTEGLEVEERMKYLLASSPNAPEAQELDTDLGLLASLKGKGVAVDGLSC